MNLLQRTSLASATLLLGFNAPASAATYLLGLNEKYEQFSELKSLLRDDDTILVTTDIWSYGDFSGLRLTIRAEAAEPRLVWNAGFNQNYKSTLELDNKARVTVENLDIVGAKGGTGSSYCPINGCEGGQSGGTGMTAVNLSTGSTVLLKHCALRGGPGGRGGIYGTRSCAVCGCSPCSNPPTYAEDGRIGLSMELSGATVAETLDVKLDSVRTENGGKMVPCCSTPPVALPSSYTRPAANSMSMDIDLRDIRGRKCMDSRPPAIWLREPRKDP